VKRTTNAMTFRAGLTALKQAIQPAITSLFESELDFASATHPRSVENKKLKQQVLWDR
jgi:hypothetical protein